MPLKKICFLLCVVFFSNLPTGFGYTQLVTNESLDNYYKIDLGRGDMATIYLINGTLMFVPGIANKEYNHNCWGTWKLNEKTQVIKIRGVERCEFLKGDFNIYKQDDLLRLKDGFRTIVLKLIMSR